MKPAELRTSIEFGLREVMERLGWERGPKKGFFTTTRLTEEPLTAELVLQTDTGRYNDVQTTALLTVRSPAAERELDQAPEEVLTPWQSRARRRGFPLANVTSGALAEMRPTARDTWRALDAEQGLAVVEAVGEFVADVAEPWFKERATVAQLLAAAEQIASGQRGTFIRNVAGHLAATGHLGDALRVLGGYRQAPANRDSTDLVDGYTAWLQQRYGRA